MNRKREFVAANVAALIVLLIALIIGWWDAALFGLAVLVLLDLWVLLRERLARSQREREE